MNKITVNLALFVLTLVVFPYQLFSQESLKIAANPITPQENQTPYGLKDFSIYELNAKALWDFVSQKGQTELNLDLHFSEEHHWELVLQPSKVFSENSQYNLENGELAPLKHKIKTYKGYLKNQSHIPVRFTISENFVHGFIFDKKGHSFEMLEEAAMLTKNTQVLVYEENQVKNESKCGHAASIGTPANFHLENLKPQAPANLTKTASKCVDLAITLDWQGYQNVANSNTTTFQNTLATMVNIVNGYHLQFDVEYQVAFTHYIYNSPNPWTDAPGDEDILTQNFAAWAFPNLQPTNYNCAMLLTGTDMNGIGYAFFGHMCPGDNLRYSEVDYQYSQPTTQRANLMTHELGHLWGAQHTSSSNSYNIMSAQIWDGNLTWDSNATNIITDAIDTEFASCLNACGITDPCANAGGDADGDGYCADVDCYDNIATAYPGAPEICDNIDNNCNGQTDENNVCGGGTYCTPIHLTSHITNVSIGTINNPSGDANTATTGYSDHTNLSTDLADGVSYTLTVNANNSSANSKLSAWIDWNQNFTFEASEQITSQSGVGSWTASFTAPNGATVGNTRLRIRLQENAGNTPDACAYSASYSGETEDYTVNVEGCTQITFYADNDGDGFGDLNNSLQACSMPSGYVANSTDCHDGNSTIYPNAPELCDNEDNNCNGQTDENACGSEDYCEPIHVGSQNELITNVTVGTINNTSGGWTTTTTGYSDYTNLSTNLNAGETYTMSVTNNYGWDDTRFGVWADWNQNFTFEANEEVFSFNGDGPWTFSITPPNNASLGTTRLRVRLQFGGNYVPDPCDYANFYSGETEDYTLNILGSSGCSTTSIDFNDFENGWGIWNDGGSDARRNSLDQAYAQGTYCVRLRDNTSTSVMTTDNLDLSSFEDITVDFSYYPLSMDNSNEDFWLQISTNGGTSFTTVEEWNLNDEFQNDNTYYESVNIQGPFTSNTQLRFRCDASGNSDWVHIDDVHIKGCSSSNNPIVYNNNTGNHFSKQGETILLDKEKNNEGKMTVFPNPASNELMVKYEAAENTKVSVELYSLEGKKVGTQSIEALKGENTIRLNTSQLPTGMYLLKVNESNRHLSKRVVISR